MKTILCATDYSKNSNAALKLAYTLSQKVQAKLIVLHVFDLKVALLTPLSLTYVKMEKQAYQKHSEKLSVLCDSVLGLFPDGERVKCKVKENALAHQGILEAQKETQADLVVIGMKGGAVVKGLLLGSNTTVLLEKCPCPVLAVPATLKTIDIKTMTYASDFEESDLHAIEWLIKNMAIPLKARLTICHVSTKKEYAAEEQMEWFKEILAQKITYDQLDFKIYFSENIFEVLQLHLTQTNSEVVAMLEREKSSIIKSLYHIDMVKRMESKAILPLLSFNKKMIKQTI